MNTIAGDAVVWMTLTILLIIFIVLLEAFQILYVFF